MISSSSYENSDTIQRQVNIFFSRDDHLKITKKNIIQICFSDILCKLCFTMHNNDIVLDYRYFKFISTPDSYEKIIDYIVFTIQNVLKKQDTFIFHVNMNSITLLHIEKYFPFIQQISEVLKTTFPDKLNTCYIYNAPYIFSKLFSVVSMFIDKKTQQKIQLVENE